MFQPLPKRRVNIEKIRLSLVKPLSYFHAMEFSRSHTMHAAILVAWCFLYFEVTASELESPTIDSLVNEYQTRLDQLDLPLVQLEKQYSEALDRNLRAVQEAGDLDGVVAYSGEVERLQTSLRPPHDLSEVVSLAKLQVVFRDNYEAKDAQIKEARDKVRLKTLERMDEILKNLTREGKLEEAVVLQEITKQFSETGVVVVPPFFKERIPADRFWEKLEEEKERLDLAGVKKARLGASGVLVDGVSPGSAAERIGMQVGDRILTVGETELWSHLRLDWKHDAPERIVIWQSPDGRRHSEPVPSGRLGVDVEGDILLHAVYFEAGKADPRWDDLILVALLVAELDPAMAETALFHAVRLGYPLDAITGAVGITLALREGRIEVAQIYADQLLSTAAGNPAALPRALYPVYFRARLAAGRLDLAYEAEKATSFVLGGLNEDKWMALLASWNEVRPKWSLRMRPSLRFATMATEDVFSRRRLTEDEKIVPKMNQEIHRTARGGDAYAVPPGRVINSYHTVEGGIDNFVWETEIQLEPSPSEGEHLFPAEFKLSVPYRNEAGEVRTAAQIALSVNPAGRKRIIVGGGGAVSLLAFLAVNWGSEASPTRTRVRIIRLGREIEIQINGVTQCWMPLVGAMPEPGFRTDVLGLKAVFRDGKLLKLP